MSIAVDNKISLYNVLEMLKHILAVTRLKMYYTQTIKSLSTVVRATKSKLTSSSTRISLRFRQFMVNFKGFQLGYSRLSLIS